MLGVVADERWTTAEAAAYLKITPALWRHYVSRRVPLGNPAPGPDGRYDARTPWWWASTVKAWHARRPRAGKAAS